MTNSGINKCARCDREAKISMIEASNDLKEYACNDCFYIHLRQGLLYGMPEFIKKYYFKKNQNLV